MKLFEVTTEHCESGKDEILTTRHYVTADKDSLKLVVDHFTQHCHEYDKDLIGVREVLSITQHIEN